MKLTTHFHHVPRLKMREALFGNSIRLHGVVLEHRDSFLFAYCINIHLDRNNERFRGWEHP
jgi:hypothetical protein